MKQRLYLFLLLFCLIGLLAKGGAVGCSGGNKTESDSDEETTGGGEGNGTDGEDTTTSGGSEGGDSSGGSGDGSGSISDLPEGVAVTGTLGGTEIEVSDGNLDYILCGVYDMNKNGILEADVDDSLTLAMAGNTSNNAVVHFSLVLNRATVNTTLTTGTLYELSVSPGEVTLNPNTATEQTFSITSSRVIFTTLNVTEDNTVVAGSTELHFSDSSDSLTAEFNGCTLVSTE